MKSKHYSQIKSPTKELTVKTGNKTFDDFISSSSGFVVGSAIFLTGTPGAGKTTLSVVLQKLLENHISSLYSREMSSSSLAMQMKRYKISHKNAYIADKDQCPTIDSYIEELNCLKPSIVIIDSLQVIVKEDFSNLPTEKTAFEIIQRLRSWTEQNNAILIVIGHVNKDGGFEGKNTIEHMFDAHLEMIYDKKKNTRILSWAKNRKGASDVILYYEFGEKSIDFFTKEQYLKNKQNKGLEDFILDALTNYVNSFDKTSDNYKSFRKELKKDFQKILTLNDSFMDKTLKCAEKVKEQSERFNLS